MAQKILIHKCGKCGTWGFFQMNRRCECGADVYGHMDDVSARTLDINAAVIALDRPAPKRASITWSGLELDSEKIRFHIHAGCLYLVRTRPRFRKPKPWYTEVK